jgi:CHAT domain-containing protein
MFDMKIPIKIKLTEQDIDNNQYTVSIEKGYDRTQCGRFSLPWKGKISPLSSLLDNFDPNSDFLIKNRNKIKKMNLDLKEINNSGFLEYIGYKLYESIFKENKEIENFLKKQIKNDREIVQIHILKNDNRLQSYPWELLNDGRNFLFSGNKAILVRCINLDDFFSQIKLEDTMLSILYVAPRPNNSNLQNKEYECLKNILNEFKKKSKDLQNPLIEKTDISIIKENVALSELRKKVLDDKFNILHIDTHGIFGWLDKDNNKIEYKKQRQNYGHLLFEENGVSKWINADSLSTNLKNTNIKIVMLSACSSAVGRFDDSVAGAIIGNGIPCVIGMRFAIDEDSAAIFIKTFYSALISYKPLTEAVDEARLALCNKELKWYCPVLYLMSGSDNCEGRIFQLSKDDEIRKIVSEISEWKFIHHETQSTLSSLESISQNLDSYFKKKNSIEKTEIKRTAFISWSTCAGKLKLIRNKVKNFKDIQYAYKELYKDIIKFTDDKTFKPIGRDFSLMNNNSIDKETADHIKNSYALLWQLLSVSDENIKKLIEELK